MKSKTVSLATAVFLMLLAPCIPGAAGNSAPADTTPKTLHFAVLYNFEGKFDPVEMNYINLQVLFRSIYSTLFKVDSQLRAYPFLLESFQQKGKVVIFQLKEEARFSDGSPITSEEVSRSIEAGMRHSSFPNPVYKLLEGGEDFFQGKTRNCSGIKIIGPKTLEIHLKNETENFAYYFTAGIMSILPLHRNQGQDPGKMIFSGAFRAVSLEKKTGETVVTLEPNPFYTGEKSKIAALYLHYYDSHQDFEETIRKGEPDLFLYNRHFKLPYSTHRYHYFKTPTTGGFYFKLNACRGPFQDKRLRSFFKEFILSWDLAGSNEYELAAPCKMVLPYSLPGYFVFSPMVPGDFKKLAPKNKIKIRCVNPKTGIRVTVLPLLKKKLGKYNLELELEWEDIDKIQEREKKGEVDLTAYYYLVDVPLSSYFYENLFTPGHELNLFGYSVPEALELLTEYRKETDEFKRLKILSRLETIAQEEAFFIPLLNPLTLVGYKSYVKNVKIDKFLNIAFEEIDVKKRH